MKSELENTNMNRLLGGREEEGGGGGANTTAAHSRGWPKSASCDCASRRSSLLRKRDFGLRLGAVGTQLGGQSSARAWAGGALWQHVGGAAALGSLR